MPTYLTYAKHNFCIFHQCKHWRISIISLNCSCSCRWTWRVRRNVCLADEKWKFYKTAKSSLKNWPVVIRKPTENNKWVELRSRSDQRSTYARSDAPRDDLTSASDIADPVIVSYRNPSHRRSFVWFRFSERLSSQHVDKQLRLCQFRPPPLQSTPGMCSSASY